MWYSLINIINATPDVCTIYRIIGTFAAIYRVPVHMHMQAFARMLLLPSDTSQTYLLGDLSDFFERKKNTSLCISLLFSTSTVLNYKFSSFHDAS